MGKIIKHGQASQAEVIRGVEKAVNAIKTTMGPAGKHVAIVTQFGTEVSRDGSIIAQSIQFSDPAENIGAELVKKAAKLTEDSVGDGTSTTSLLIKEFCNKGQKAVATGSNVNEIKSGMIKARDWVKEYIKSCSTPIDGDLESIRKVATISANNDNEIGNLVVKSMEDVGIDGVITAELSSGIDTYISTVSGLKLERGWSSPQYITSPEDGKCVLDNPYIIVVGETISSVNQILNIIGDLSESKRPFLIICDDITENVNTTLIMNTLSGAIRCCVVKGVDFGDGRKNIMQDVATVVGGVYFSPETGKLVKDAKLWVNRNDAPETRILSGEIGIAERVIISRDSCIIFNGGGNKDIIKARAEILKSRLLDPAVSDYDKMKFTKRIAGLTGGIGVIYAGGATEAEKMNLKATIDDSILASRSAIAEGYVPGGGYVYYKASLEGVKDKKFWSSLVGDEVEGAKIVFSSLPCVTRTIAENTGGVAPDIVLEGLKKKTTKPWGYNAKTKSFGYLVEEGILDSAKGLRVALENSISTASMILLIDCLLIEEEEGEKNIGI